MGLRIDLPNGCVLYFRKAQTVLDATTEAERLQNLGVVNCRLSPYETAIDAIFNAMYYQIAAEGYA